MRVLFAASEVAPFAKTGGLADVAAALPVALARLGVDVRVVLPLYRQVDRAAHAIRETGVVLEVPISGRTERVAVHEGRLAGRGGIEVPVYFLEADRYYDRDGLYGIAGQDFQDNAERFAVFSRAVLELGRTELGRPDLFHCHDWQTGLVPVQLESLYADDPSIGRAASVFTIHNLGYQGLFWHYDMHLTGLGWEHFTPAGIEFWGKISFLKAGLVYADLLTTVSPTYAREIQTEEMGHGLDGVLRARADRLIGILNGIDVDEWNPETDPYIPKRYSAADLSGKAAAKAALQRAFRLPEEPDTPLIGVVTRLADQKGCDLIAEALPQITARGAQFVLLGAGDPVYENLFRDAAARDPSRVGVTIAYDHALSHLVEAGADLFLMPSRYEPCGLNQMMSLRYGTVPVVRATGGLADTVVEAPPEAGGNGFVFGPYETAALVAAVDRALALYRDRERWRALQVAGMSADFSWDASARRYLEVYQRALVLAGSRMAGESVGASLGGPADEPAAPRLAEREARRSRPPDAARTAARAGKAAPSGKAAKTSRSGKGKGGTRRPGRKRDG